MIKTRPVGTGMNYGTLYAPYKQHQTYCTATECVQYDESQASNCKVKKLQFTTKARPLNFDRCVSCLKERKLGSIIIDKT